MPSQMSRLVISRPLYMQVYDIVKSMIVSGELKPGQLVTEGSLSERLGVSRTPIREATKRLISEGLLHSSRAGLTIYRPSLEDIAQIYVTRSCLEGFAARLAAHAMTPTAIRQLNAILDQAEPAVRELQGDRAAKQNARFHGLIRKIAGNQRLDQLIGGLEPMISLYRQYSLMFPENLSRSLVDHRAIVRLFEDGASDEIESAVRSHVLRAGFRVTTALSKLEGAELPPASPTMQLLGAYGQGFDVRTSEAVDLAVAAAKRAK